MGALRADNYEDDYGRRKRAESSHETNDDDLYGLVDRGRRKQATAAIGGSVQLVSDPAPTALTEVHLPPRFLLFAAESSLVTSAAWAWAESGLVVRVVRGRKMKTEQGVFDEVGAAFQFPYYFGENWDAMDECIADLEWLPTDAGYVLVITDADQALIADGESLNSLARVLARAIEEWATPVERNEWWDRRAIAFGVVLQAAPANAGVCRDRWETAGASVEDLT